MKVKAVKPDQLPKGKREPKQIDYSKLPKFTEAEWYNMMVYGQKTVPKNK